jgi:hypothetical protein
MNKKNLLIAILFIVSIFASSCGPAPAAPTATLTPTAIITLTSTITEKPPTTKQTATMTATALTATPTLTPTITETPNPTVSITRQVELVFAPDNVVVPNSCKVVPEATADNTLTLNGEPLPDGTVIDDGWPLSDEEPERISFLLIPARAVAIEYLDTFEEDNTPVDEYLVCFNFMLPSGDNVVIVSTFKNLATSGSQNTLFFILPDTDVAGVTIDQMAEHHTPLMLVSNSDYLALFTSGKIVGQQVLLPFEYDFLSSDWAASENPASCPNRYILIQNI